jgi:uncharacterized protein YbjT (DUF2867 family)
MKVHVIGASGRSGAVLCGALGNDGVHIVPVVRSAARWAATGLAGAPGIADLSDAHALQGALRDAERIVSCAHARHAAAILAAAPPGARFVFLGSTRKFTRWPDAHGNGVLTGEAAFLASGRPGVMLHPTMIYGAEGENNVQRLAALLKKIPFVPLPDGGRALVQPIHQDDVTASIRAALAIDWAGPETIVIAGPSALTYADFVRAIAKAARLPPPNILSVPAAPLRVAAHLTAALPFLPRIGPDEIRRLTEDKAFPIGPMLAHLGVTPRPLDAGLASIGW